MCLDLRVSGQRGDEWVSLYTHYCGGDDRGVPISEGLCVSSFFALQHFSRPDQTRPALQGGWVCFQFSPLPCPGKHHFQNQTERVLLFFLFSFSKRKEKKKFSDWPQCLSPSFHVSDFYSRLCGDIKLGRGGKEEGLRGLKPTRVPHLTAGWMSRAPRRPAQSTEPDAPSEPVGESCSLADVQNVQEQPTGPGCRHPVRGL